MAGRKKDSRQQILDTALKLAEEKTWEDLSLSDIADALDISLYDIQQHYSQKDDLVEAWFDRADQAMLQISPEELADRKIADRLELIIFTWLDVLAAHKQVTRDMLWYKLEPLHVHLQVLGLLRISRTVQWIRELVGLEDRFVQRIINEIGLTTIYLCTFLYWLQDASANQTNTRQFLQRKLQRIENCCCKLNIPAPNESTA